MLSLKVNCAQEMWYPLLKVGHTYNETGIAKVISVNGTSQVQPRDDVEEGDGEDD